MPKNLNGSEVINNNILASKLNLQDHYYPYVENLKVHNAKVTQGRILKQIAILELKDKEKQKQMKKVVEDEKIQNIEKMFIGKGSATANKRIFLEYKGLTSSKEFKNSKIVMEENNIYKWKILFEILKFDLSKELKQDFETIKKISGESVILLYIIFLY